MAKLSSRNYKEEVDKVMGLLKDGKPLVLYDLETTGLKSATSKILSCSAIKVRYEDGMFKEVGVLDQFINPCIPIPEEASKVNGITNEKVENEPDEWTAFEEVIYPFFGDDPIVGGYNILKFDNKFMKMLWLRSSGREFDPEACIDVIRMVDEKMDLKSKTLGNAAATLGVDFGIAFHTSLDDVRVTLRVLEALLQMYEGAEKPAKFRFKILGVGYQYYSHKNERVYIHTYPKSTSYYDVYSKKFNCEGMDDFSLNDLMNDVYKFMGVDNEKDFVKLAKERQEEKESSLDNEE